MHRRHYFLLTSPTRNWKATINLFLITCIPNPSTALVLAEQLSRKGFGGVEPLGAARAVVNLAKICERYGGGGHARVGAISFNVNQHAAAI